jgi:hypothetical protein
VTSTFVDLPFTDAKGRRRVVYAAMRDSGDWDVRGIVGGRLFSRQCDSWQGVERTVLWLRRHAHEPVPTSRRVNGPVAAAIGLLLLFGGSEVAFAQLQETSPPSIQAFVEATREYAALHRRLEGNLPKLEVTSNPDTILRVVEQMRAALQNARLNASPGEFFTEAVAEELRGRIADALAASDLTAADVREAEAHDGVDPAMVPLQVNGRFQWIYATAMFPCVLNALPQLPPELQYRIVGNTLVLIDIHASLIVDLLPYALTDTER